VKGSERETERGRERETSLKVHNLMAKEKLADESVPHENEPGLGSRFCVFRFR
jgi:hypothetical protein